MKNCRLNILLLITLSLVLLHTPSSHALNLHFGEGDFSIREGSGKLRAIVVAQGEFSGSVTVQVVPMTVSQFLNKGLTPVPDALSNPDLDPAEAGADFNDEVLTFTLQGGPPSIEKTLQVDILDDDISEHSEVFLLVLKVVNATEGIDIEVERNVSVARIRQDSDATKTKVGFNGSSLNVDEGSGLLNDTLFIEIDGIAEPTLYVQLSMQDGINPHSDDIRLLETTISIPSGATRVPVPLEIIDDVIVEELYEFIQINVAPSSDQQALFATGAFATVQIIIKDNDRPHFGFEVTSAASNSSRQIIEGESARVCVLLLEPETEFETEVDMSVQLTSDSVPLLIVNGLDEHGYFFTRDNLKFCFNITANENEVINEPKTAMFTLTPRLFIYEEDLQRIDVDDLYIVIRDNDGIPKPPGNIELTLTNNGQDLLVTWNSESSKLQPISQYRVSVRSTNVDTKSNIRSRRQSEPELQEYVTTEERFLLEKVENEKTYTIQVCAENDFGHACADSNEFTIRGKEGEPRMVVLISDGLEPSDDAESATIATLSQGYVIAIILLPLILLLVVCILVISVIIYSCCRYNSKHYYPSQQEKKMEKQIEAMEGRYRARSLSSGSINSTTSSASEFTRV